MYNQNQSIGIFYMLIHCFLISVLSAMIRHISNDFHIFQIVFFHNIIALILVLIYIIFTNKYKYLATKKLNLHIYRAILGVISLCMYFYAFTVIPLTQARAIALTGPLVSSLFAIIFLKEVINIHRILALIAGFIGALIILSPTDANFSYAIFLVIGAVIMWAIIEMIIKIIGRSEHMVTQLFYLTGLMSILSLPMAFIYWQTPLLNSHWFFLIAIGVIFLVNIMAVFTAFRNADITILMPFDFSGMVFTTIIAYIIFAEIINIPTMLGSIIIVISSVYLARKEAKIITT